MAPLSSKKGASWAVWSGVLRDGAGEAEGELGGFVDVGDVGAVGGDGAGEDLALLEEADFFYVAVEVVGEHGDHAGDEGWAEEGGFFGERVFHGDGCACLLLPRGEEVWPVLSDWVAKVLEMDSLKPRARRRVRTAASFAAVGWAMTGSGVGRVLAKRL